MEKSKTKQKNNIQNNDKNSKHRQKKNTIHLQISYFCWSIWMKSWIKESSLCYKLWFCNPYVWATQRLQRHSNIWFCGKNSFPFKTISRLILVCCNVMQQITRFQLLFHRSIKWKFSSTQFSSFSSKGDFHQICFNIRIEISIFWFMIKQYYLKTIRPVKYWILELI